MTEQPAQAPQAPAPEPQAPSLPKSFTLETAVGPIKVVAYAYARAEDQPMLVVSSKKFVELLEKAEEKPKPRTIIDGLCQLSASLAAKGCDRGDIVITLPDVAYDALESECDPSRELRHELVISCSHGTMFKVRRQLIPPEICTGTTDCAHCHQKAREEVATDTHRAGSRDMCFRCGAGMGANREACSCDSGFFLELAEKAGEEIRAMPPIPFAPPVVEEWCHCGYEKGHVGGCAKYARLTGIDMAEGCSVSCMKCGAKVPNLGPLKTLLVCDKCRQPGPNNAEWF